MGNTATSRPLTVIILARLHPMASGGTTQAVMGTVAALGRLTDGDEQYVAVTDATAPDWLDPYIGPNTRVVPAPPLPAPAPWSVRLSLMRRRLTAVAPVLRSLRRAVQGQFQHVNPPVWAVAPCDPFIEALQPDVVYFPYQWLHLTSAPSIFDPQDAQHVHFPQFFDPAVKTYREHMFPLWCQASSVVEVPSYSTKHDLVTHLGVAADKVAVVPKAPPTELAAPPDDETLRQVRQAYELPDVFALYPGQTWEHKNHIRLLEAVAVLRDRHGVRLPLICSGRQSEFFPSVRAKVKQLRLADQVRFLGFIPPEHVRALYHQAEFIVYPSLFEGGGFPLLEAFREGSPLACSNIPVLVEQAGDAALLFDPTSAEDMAHAMLRLHQNDELRAELRRKGKERARGYSWDHTARTYRALFRKLANRPLLDGDAALLRQAFERTSA